jgi:hypothetical protein
MTPSTPAVSPLRQRMLDDMRMRKLGPKTQAAYVRAVRYLAGFLQRSPDTATAEDLRRFQLHMVDRGVSPVTLNATITGALTHRNCYPPVASRNLLPVGWSDGSSTT